MREKIEPVHIILLVIGVVLLSGFIFLALRLLRTTKYSADFSYTLESVDAFIRTEKYPEALKLIEGLRSYPDYRGDWLRLLKRSWLLAGRMGAYELFASLALRAHGAYPDDEELAAIAAIALIDAEKAGDAVSLLGKLESLDFRSVAAEIHVLAGTAPPPEEARGELIYAILPESRNPLDFVAAGELSGEPGFSLDAALLFLEEGKREEALALLAVPATGAAYPFLSSLVFYDAGDFGKSDEYWDLLTPEEKMSPRALELRADSFLRQRRYEASENYHNIFLTNYAAHSSIPYLAMNFLLHRKDRFSGGGVLSRGLTIFPREPRLMLDYAKTLVAQNKKDEAEELARRIFGDSAPPETEGGYEAAVDARVLSLVARLGDVPLGRITAELWMLHNDYPEAASVAALLRPQLFSTNDFSGLRRLLEDVKSDAHAYSYRAALDFSEGGFLAARAELEEAAEKFPGCPEVSYNLGLVNLALKNIEGALGSFQRAAEHSEFAQTASLEEHTTLRIFDTLVLLGRYPEATRMIRAFLEENSGHPEALQKFRKLEARRE
ncbi:MAG: tetratricopeptide repeat protein [Spirochaetaceae bacterium]|nr:tetratricopeptide repeat protein [Spirochaetaceae bacterium]